MPRRGENIDKRKDGRFEGRFNPDSSLQKYKYVYAPTYKLAKEKLIELKMNKHFESDKIVLMCELCKEWLEFKKEDIKESTYIKYRNIILNHINPHIGNAYINRLQSEDMQKYIFSLKIGGLSNKSVRDILSVVSAIFKYAENKGFNTNNLYFENLYPKSEKKQIKLLSADERIRLEKRIIKSKNPSEYGILLALYSGMRIGEICALKWENIDLKAGTISVCQTLQRLQDKENKGKTKILITEPKSQSSKRIIPIPAFLSALLKQIQPKNPCAFFLTGDNYFMEPRTLDNIFKKCLSDCDIQRINFHALRHTFATRCVEAGFDIKTLSEILGHSNVSTTLNLYAHPTLEHKRANMNKLVPFE